MAVCCANCFNEKHARLQEFIAKNGRRRGHCDFCGEWATVIEARELEPLFERFLQLFHPLQTGVNVLPDDDWFETGETLATLINDRYSVISDAALDKANELIEAIFTDGLHPGDAFGVDVGASGLWTSSDNDLDVDPAEADWDYFASHIRHKRRFIVDDNEQGVWDPRHWLPKLVSGLAEVLPVGAKFYRARGGYHPKEEMGAPPPEKAAAGRANPLGIPFLYLATNRETVVAELRPWRGQVLSIAEFVLAKDVRVVDLTVRARGIHSPFDHSVDELKRARDDYRLTWRLGEALSIPIDPEKTPIDYLPTQYLTEVIRDAGYDGMIYRSALGPGKNLVLFSPGSATARSVEQVEVTNMSYGVASIQR